MLSFDGKNQMHSVLNNNLFLVKEHVDGFKAANNFDIYDPESGDVILHCREPRLGMLTKLFRLLTTSDLLHLKLRLRHHPVSLSVQCIVFFISSFNG